MNFDLKTIIIVCPLVFLAGFIDSIAGGGGIISLPTYMFVGLPVHFASGTNKFSSTCGTTFSVVRYVRNKKVSIKSALFSVVTALIGSFLGAKLALSLDAKYLKYCLMIILPLIAIFLIIRKDFGSKNTSVQLSSRMVILLSMLAGLIIGAYDGFAGPGTGTFLILIYTAVIGFDLTTASGNAKIVNLASNVAALATFLFNGKVLFWLAFPAALSGILGNWLGSGLAIKNGSKVIKPIFMVVVILLFVKISIDILSK